MSYGKRLRSVAWIAMGDFMKASAAVFTGACLFAATVLAQPKEPIAKAPVAAKGPASAAKPIARTSPIEGFALSNTHAFEVGELKTSCRIDRKGRELTMKTTVVPTERSEYGGCCFEHTEALPLDAGATVTAWLSLSPSEEMVHVDVEQSSGMSQLYLLRGRLEAGSHQLAASNLELSEVRRLCVAVYSGPQSLAHEAVLKIKRVAFDAEASVKPSSPISRR
jgi:hypothetical protein